MDLLIKFNQVAALGEDNKDITVSSMLRCIIINFELLCVISDHHTRVKGLCGVTPCGQSTGIILNKLRPG